MLEFMRQLRIKYQKYEDFGYLLSGKYMTNMWTFEKKLLNLWTSEKKLLNLCESFLSTSSSLLGISITVLTKQCSL
jgi:hypothetical protein